MQIPADIQQLLNHLRGTFSRTITAELDLPASPGSRRPLPDSLRPELRDILLQQGISSLYEHQAAAFDAISANRDTAIVSRTASGKTLSFLLPILNEFIQAPKPFSTLLLYPTKALSRDQESTLARLAAAASRNALLGTFDGDTPVEVRHTLQRSADFVITNPDMLHSGILPNHGRAWKAFLSRLRYIVIDEVHTYRGAFGSHVANVFRRLLRLCELYGVQPSFVCCSATVANPAEHVRALFGRDVTLIDQDSSPRPARKLFCINPPMLTTEDGASFRKGPASVTVPILRFATEHNIRTICFCRGRQEVERLRNTVIDGRFAFLADRIKPYRGGLLPNERRQLENDLFTGRINTVISTNALELGIDIGSLELCILSGHPGSMASFWQQAGRVGRKGGHPVIVFVAKDSPIDQYMVNHPDFITSTPIEQAWLNADNPYIVLQHLPCAAHEYPLRPHEPLFGSQAAQLAIALLKEQNTLRPWGQNLRYALRDYPAKGVNIRGMTDYNVQILHGSVVIGEIDPIGARGTLYKDAIYQHLGQKYMSTDLDLERKTCHVELANVDYFTEASWENRVEITEVFDHGPDPQTPIDFGAIHVNMQPKLYKKIRERTYENIGYGPITLDPFEYDTTGFSLRPSRAWLEMADTHDRRWLGAALHGLAYILRRAAPALCMADEADISTDISLIPDEQDRWNSALFLFDTHEGGVGYAEKIFERLPEALALCRHIIAECPCHGGCPACVPPLPPGVITTPDLDELLLTTDAALQCTESLIAALLEHQLLIPTITSRQLHVAHPAAQPTLDPQTAKLQQRLGRAADILAQKRARLH